MRWMTRWPMRGLIAGQFTKADAIELPSFSGGPGRPLVPVANAAP
jgi:hypothetical protein